MDYTAEQIYQALETAVSKLGLTGASARSINARPRIIAKEVVEDLGGDAFVYVTVKDVLRDYYNVVALPTEPGQVAKDTAQIIYRILQTAPRQEDVVIPEPVVEFVSEPTVDELLSTLRELSRTEADEPEFLADRVRDASKRFLR